MPIFIKQHLTFRCKLYQYQTNSNVYINEMTDWYFWCRLALSVFLSLSYTHTSQPVPAHTHTHTPVSLLQRSEWFRSQLSHITGEEGVRPSIKELFKWNHVLWWFKANISLEHFWWMCSSEEQARTLLLRSLGGGDVSGWWGWGGL